MDKDFVDIINNHRSLIYKVCHVYCRDEEDRKDLFQEIVLQVWRSLKTFRHESALSTWMYRVALNTAITHFRREIRRPTGRSTVEELDIPDVPSAEEDLSADLFRAVDQLDKLDKSIVLLYLDDKSYTEISDITGLTVSNVGVRLNRIKTKLQHALKILQYGTRND